MKINMNFKTRYLEKKKNRLKIDLEYYFEKHI